MARTATINHEKISDDVSNKVIKNQNKWYKSWWMNLVYGYILGIFSSLTVLEFFT